jgi:soluble lytic murein transglycosylase-like protein
MIKKLWGVGIVFVLMTFAMPAMADSPEADGLGPFADVDGSVHENDVAALWAADITSGCEEWLYCPDEPVSRGEMAAFLARALELPRSDDASFVDTVGSQFGADIQAIADAGITAGCGEGEYCPAGEVTRGQMASFLARALNLPAAEGNPFVDDDGNIHEADIAAIAAAGITRGCDEDSFCPERTVTRAEMASFLARALELLPPVKMPEIPSDVLDELAGPEWPTGPGPEGWRTLIEEYFRAGDVARAMRVMACESLGDPNARNPRSGASGLFQHMPRYWSERSASAGFGGRSIFDPEANVGVAAWMIYEYPGGGWKHWVCK